MANLNREVQKLKQVFIERGMTLALAESCTGGLLSSVIASEPGVSTFYLGGVVSYHAQVKQKILAVPESMISCFGEVSEPVAMKMASGVRNALQSTWSVAITGVAGPSGGTVDKPVGMVCFSICGPGVHVAKTIHFGSSSRSEIQFKSAATALGYLLEQI